MIKIILEDSRGLQGATPEAEAARWDQPGPPRCRPIPGGGPRLSTSEMFLHRLHRLHLHCSSSRFDSRAHVGPFGLYKKTPAPLRHKSFEIKSSRVRNPNILRAPIVSRALAS
jgi:hypothetical protein